MHALAVETPRSRVIESGDLQSPIDRPPLFILGSPRSGTTLLASLLADSPWGKPIETHFIPKYYRRLQQRGDLSDWRVFYALVRGILAERPIAQLQLRLDPDTLYDSMRVCDYPHLVNAIGHAYAASRGYASWGDKTPEYLSHVELLHDLFPTAPMIYIVRDGRDVARSLMQESWGPATIYACAQKWRSENAPKAIMATLRAKGLLFELRYEDLLAAPDAMLHRISTFLAYAASPDRMARLASTVKRQNAGKWRANLQPAAVAVFETVAGETLRRFGYETTRAPESIGPLDVAMYGVQDTCKRLRSLFTMNVIDTIRIRAFGKQPFAE